MTDTVTKCIAYVLGPILRPASRWMLAPERRLYTWHFELMVIAPVLLLVAAWTAPSPFELATEDAWRQFLISWLSAFAVIGSFMHAKVGYRMAEAMVESKAPPLSCYEWSGRYWLWKEVLWFLVFFISGAYPALVGTLLFILYPAWRRIHVAERRRLRSLA